MFEIEHSARITMQAFEVSDGKTIVSLHVLTQENQIAIGILAGAAIACAIGRLCIRVLTRRRLYYDDVFLILALACVCGGTGILYKRCKISYIEFALLRQMPEAYSVSLDYADDLLNQITWQFAYVMLLWTTIFAIKWCFFAHFHPLLRNMSKSMTRFYWLSIAFSVLCWSFLALPVLRRRCCGMLSSVASLP